MDDLSTPCGLTKSCGFVMKRRGKKGVESENTFFAGKEGGMSNILTLDPSKKKIPTEDEAEAKNAPAQLHDFRPKNLFFEPKSIPPADRLFTCFFCGDVAARWFEVSQSNIILIFEETIRFCLDPKCARRARRKITEIAPFPSQHSLTRLFSKIPGLQKLLPSPNPDK